MKTISLKKVSAVAVASLGFGLLSVVPAQADAINVTSTGVATAPTVATTTATPAPVGSAITVTLNTVLAAAATAAASITVTYTLENPNGTAVTSDATFTSAAGAVSGVTATNTGAAYSLAIANGAAGNTKATGTMVFTPRMGGAYVLKYTNSAFSSTGNADTSSAQTGVTAATIYVTGSGAVVAASGIGTQTIGAVVGGQAQVRFATAAKVSGEVYNLTSSGVGSIQTVGNGGATNAASIAGIAASSDFSQGARITGSANTDTNAVIATVASTVAGTQTLTWTSINATTGVPSVVATQVITWGAAPALAVATTTAKVNIPASTTASGTDSSTPIARTASGEQARIVLTIRDASGNALNGQALSATITGSGLIRAFDGDGGGAGNARATSVTVTGNVASIGVNADGTTGTGTISILVGTTVVSTKTVTFFGPPATVTAVQNHKVLSTSGGAIGSNTTTPTGADIANTPAVILTVLDSNGTRIPGLTSANISAVSSDPTVMSTALNIQENAGTGTGNLVSRTYNVQVSSVAKASGSTATLTFRVALGTTPETYVTAAPLTYTLGGGVASVTLGLDRTSYTPGQAASVSISVRDSSGNPAFDADHASILAGALSTSLGIAGTISFGTTSAIVSSLGGVAVAKINAPATGGTWTVSGTTGTGPSTASEKSKAISVSATVVSENAGLLTQIDALNAKIVALNALIAKIMKKLGVK